MNPIIETKSNEAVVRMSMNNKAKAHPTMSLLCQMRIVQKEKKGCLALNTNASKQIHFKIKVLIVNSKDYSLCHAVCSRLGHRSIVIYYVSFGWNMEG